MKEHLSRICERISDALFGHPDGGVYFFVSAEVEFYLIPECDLKKVVHAIKQIGISNRIYVGELEQEDGINQFEIQTEPTSELFQLCNFIKALQDYATQPGSQIIMKSKPFSDQPGSAIHFHISLYDCNDVSLFATLPHIADGKCQPTFYYAVAGMMHFMPKCIKIFAPTENCYKRFIPKKGELFKHHPSTYSWGINNRTCAIRIPQSITIFPADTRIEHRVCSVMINPHEALLAIISGIGFGIQQRLVPMNPTFGDAFNYIYNLPRLPISIEEASTTAQTIEQITQWIKM